MILALALACTPKLDLPDDPALPGETVGVRTVTIDGREAEIWYPAHPRHDGDAPDTLRFAEALDADVLARIGDLDVPELTTPAVRDAELHPDGPFHAIVFSHGFGGTRNQSFSLTAHLASRGFVVVAVDHEGRSIAELVPCMFSPPMEGCALAFDDPAPPDVAALGDWLEAPDQGFEEAIDASALGLFGHSAGGITTTTVGNTDARFTALAPMAGGDVVEASVAVQRWAGSCDDVVPASSSREAHDQSTVGDYLEIEGAGHLAFSDLCGLDLGGLLSQLAERDDVSPLFVEQARTLATDGCPEFEPTADSCDAFLPLETSEAVLKAELAAFFEVELRGTGRGPLTTLP